MDAIAEYQVPAEEFAFGRIAVPGSGIELERLYENGDVGVGYFWVGGGAREAFERAAGEEPTIADVELLHQSGNRRLYCCECSLQDSPLVDAIVDDGVTLLDAVGDDEEWLLRLSFPDRSALSSFQQRCVDEEGVGLAVESVYNPLEAATSFRSELTDRQRETLLRAYEEGYFDIPRGITLVDLAELLGVSDQAVSERLRRGEAKLVRTHLLDDL